MNEGRTDKKTIPSYALYGETDPGRLPDVLHCESVRARSLLHDWRFSPHRHHGLYQFFLIVAGGGVATIDGAEYPLRPRVALLLPPLSVHGFVFDPGTEGWVVTVPAVILERVLLHAEQVLGRLGRPAVLKCDRSVGRLFDEISEEFNGAGEGRAQSLRSLTGLLSVWFARAIAKARSDAPDRADARRALLRRFQDLVEAEYRERRPLSHYAKALGVTVPHLSRVCREVTGRSASALVQERVVLEAKRRLVYTSMSVSEVAYSLGFADPAHFTKYFTKGTGETPTAFRAEMTGAAAGQT